MERSQDPIDIPRRSPRIPANLGGRAIELSWYNSVIQIYRAPYQYLSHLRVEDEETQFNALVFGSPDGTKGLMDRGWPVRLDPEPTDHVLALYAKNQTENLGGEIVTLLGGEGETA